MKPVLDKCWTAYTGLSHTHSKEAGQALQKRKESRGIWGAVTWDTLLTGSMVNLFLLQGLLWDAILVFPLFQLFILCPLLDPTFPLLWCAVRDVILDSREPLPEAAWTWGVTLGSTNKKNYPLWSTFHADLLLSILCLLYHNLILIKTPPGGCSHSHFAGEESED